MATTDHVRVTVPCVKCGRPAAALTLPVIDDGFLFTAGKVLGAFGAGLGDVGGLLDALTDPVQLAAVTSLACAPCEGAEE